MGNPFLDRQAKRGTTRHGNHSEKRVAKSLGAQVHAASGAMPGNKSDASLKEKNFRLEMKSTINDTLKLEMGWLSKIVQEALSHGQRPALAFSFVDPQGQPRMKQHAEWVAIPMEVFKELLEG